MIAPHIAEWRKQSRELLSGKNVLTIYQGEEVKL